MTEPIPPRDLAKAAPEVAKVVAISLWHLARWTAEAAAAGTNYLARRAAAGEKAGAIMQEAASEVRHAAWKALGLRDEHGAVVAAALETPLPTHASTADLQRRGAELMRRSNDVHLAEDTHPAFARILSELTPDEGRILRLLYLEGAEPALDVRTGRPFGIGSELVARGLTMLAEQAGCRYVTRFGQYLDNLTRLGLVLLSPEPVSEPSRYQVLEAQPKVTDALKQAGKFPRMVQRSIHLTSFGVEFCRTCLPVGRTHRPSPTPHKRAMRRADARPTPIEAIDLD